MIFYLTKREHQYTWRHCLEYPNATTATRRELLRRVRLLPYERLFRMQSLLTGSYVFADLERLGVEETERSALVWNVLKESGHGIRLFNHPVRSMRRFELLRYLYDCEINDFDVYRLTDVARPRRFPVFIRGEDDHKGSITSLLHSLEDLNREIENLISQGKSRDNKIVAEYCDCSDGNGIHHKYSSLFADSRILHTSLAHSRNWIVKGTPEGAKVAVGIATPCESRLREIFELARIDYGRIDYAIVKGRLQVFEINTNPDIWLPEYLLLIARVIDCAATPKRIPVTPRYGPPRKKRKTRSYWIGRLIHWTLRTVGLMQYEKAVVEALRKLKRQIILRKNRNE